MSTKMDVEPEIEETEEILDRLHWRRTANFELITPALAALYLEKNKINRTIRPDAVAAYARDMKSGEWVTSGESIQIDWFDRVIDGQHRLEAIIQSGVTIELLVVRGLDPKAQQRIDSGIVRAYADQLKMANVAEPFSVASTLRRIHMYVHNAERVDFTSGKVTQAELEKAFAEYPGIVDTVVELKAVCRRVKVPLSLYAFTYWLLEQHNPEKAREFFDLLGKGANLDEDNPVLVLRDRIGRERDLYSQREFQVRVFWLMVLAWNHWMAGRKVRRLQLSSKISAEAFPGVAS